MKKLLSNSGIYIISVLFNKGLNFALLPILTFYLSREDYGTLALITAISTIASVYIGLFPSTFIISRFALYGKETMARYMHNMLLITIVSYFIVLAVLLLFRDLILPAGIDDKFMILILISLYSLFSVAFNVLDTLFQVEKNAFKFATLQTLQSVSAVALTLLLVIEFSYGWKGKYFAELAVFASVAVYTFWYIRTHGYYTVDTDKKKIRELTGFLFPLTFNVLGLYILGTADRIFISNMVGLEAAGVYAVAISMAFIVNIVYDSIMKAVLPFFHGYLAEGTEHGRWEVVKLTYIYSAGCIVVLVGFLLTVPYVFDLMIDPKFHQALEYIPFLAIALTFEGLRKILGGYFTFYGKVKTVAMITLSAALMNVALDYYLIGLHGPMGAAEAILITFVLLYFTNLIFVTTRFKMPWFGVK